MERSGSADSGAAFFFKAITGIRLAAVAADEFGLGQDVAFHGALSVGFGGSGFEVEFCIEGIQLEEIAVGLARRRARAPITDFAEIVASLPRTARKLLLFRDSFGKFSRVRRKVVEHPMHPGAHGRVGIVHDESEALCLCRRLGPY